MSAVLLDGTYVLLSADDGKLALTVDETAGGQLKCTEYKEDDVKDIQKWLFQNHIPASGMEVENIVTMQSFTGRGFFVPVKMKDDAAVQYNTMARILIVKPLFKSFQVRYPQKGDGGNLVLTLGDDDDHPVKVSKEVANKDPLQLWNFKKLETPA